MQPEIHHLVEHIGPKIAVLVAQVLALSLLEPDVSSLRLRFDEGSQQSSHWEETFYGLVRRALVRTEPVECEARKVVSHVRKILGHDDLIPDNVSWLASSCKGQALFPYLYETLEFHLAPSLQFYCVPGILSHQDESQSYKLRQIVGEDVLKGWKAWPEVRMTVPSSEIGSLSRFSGAKHEWKTHMEGERLVVHLSIQQLSGNIFKIDPFQSLVQSAQLWFAGSCPHPADSIPHEPIEDYDFIHPDHFLCHSTVPHGRIAVYAVRGSSSLRFTILGALKGTRGGSRPAVIGGKACLSCSLALCRRKGIEHLVC